MVRWESAFGATGATTGETTEVSGVYTDMGGYSGRSTDGVEDCGNGSC